MKIEHGKIDGDLIIEDSLELHGMVTGNIQVLRDSTLFLHGTCCKNLIIKAGGAAKVHGMVSGNVNNEGGKLDVFGTVIGSVSTSVDGSTYVDPNAVIKKQ